MNSLGYLLSSLAALCYGANPTIIGKIKTKPYQQALSTIFMLFIVGILMFFINFQTSISYFNSPNITKIIVISTISGISYTFAQILQYKSFDYLGTSKGFAFSTASILVFNAIFSLILFKDWNTTSKLLLGFGSILVIIIGAFLLSFKEKKEGETKVINKKKFMIVIAIILIEGIIFAVNLLSPNLLFRESNILIFGESMYVEGLLPTSILIFQSSGSLISMIIYALIIHFKDNMKVKKDETYEKTVLLNKRNLLGLIPGLIQAIGNMSLVYANSLIGGAIANSLSQVCAAISTIFSLIFLKEYKGKTKKEITMMLVGSLLVAIGGVAIGFTAYV